MDMDMRGVAPLRFAQIIAAGQADDIEQAVKAAYASGATHEDLLRGIEIAERLGNVSGSAISEAYLTVYYWSWTAARHRALEDALPARAA